MRRTLSILSLPATTVVCTALMLSIGQQHKADGGEEKDSPFRAAPGLFDSSQSKSLGLKTVRGTHTWLYRATDDGYKFCHHPNLRVFRDELYCMWSNGRVDEDAPGQRILYSRTKDGEVWTKPAVLTEDREGAGICVAAGFHVDGKRLVAYYTVTGGENFHRQTALTARTTQDGLTWSAPRRVTSGFYIEAPTTLKQDGLLLAGEYVGAARETKRMRLLYTSDSGGLKNWQDARIESPPLDVVGYAEPSFFHRRDGKYVVTIRNYSGHLYAATSSDRGRSWSEPIRTNFPDSTARCSAGNLPDGTAYLINNPMPKQFDRSLLTIAISRDGKLFDHALLIRGEPTKRRYDGKHKLDGWQYPHAVVWKNSLFTGYSVNKEDVAVTRIALKKLQLSDQAGVLVPKGTARLVEQRLLRDGSATQGLALTAQHYYTSTSTSIFRYDTNWKPLGGRQIRIDGVNHIGAIDHHEGFLWIGLLHGPENGKHDPKLDRSIVAKLQESNLKVVNTWDISHEVTWIDPVCFDGEHLWVGDLSDLGIHRYQIADDKLIRTGILRYPKAMHFSQGIRVVGDKLYSMHTFGEMDGLFEFDLPKRLNNDIRRPSRVWPIVESTSHLEGFDFIPGRPSQIWHAQGAQVDRYELMDLRN